MQLDFGTLIYWVVIFLADSAIQLFNNRDLIFMYESLGKYIHFGCLLWLFSDSHLTNGRVKLTTVLLIK